MAHPLHSLGLLEDAIVKIAGITGSAKIDFKKKTVFILCADNGIVEEGVTQTDSSVRISCSWVYKRRRLCDPNGKEGWGEFQWILELLMLSGKLWGNISSCERKNCIWDKKFYKRTGYDYGTDDEGKSM